MALIDKDKAIADIEQRRDFYLGQANACVGTNIVDGLDEALCLLNSLEAEEKEVDLEEHYKQWLEEYMEQSEGYYPTAQAIALHFYDLGCRHTAVMYDDIEYERQRAEEAELSGDLEGEIDRFIDDVDQKTGGRWSEDDILECARHFAEWGSEHFKK